MRKYNNIFITETIIYFFDTEIIRMNDLFYMKKAIKLAKKGIFTTSPNPNVGCIIVNNNKIVGKGWHQKTGEYHAEIIALKDAGILSKGATMYVTLEPCTHFGKTPPCCKYLVKHGINRVVIAIKDPNPINSGKGIQWLCKSGIKVTTNILAEESKIINKGFFKRMKTGYPFVQLKLASSIDGRTATENGNSKWITCNLSRQDVQIFRAQSNVILSSSSTVLYDNPLLTVRYKSIERKIKFTKEKNKNLLKQPIRVIIDSQNKVKPWHNCILEPGKVMLIRLKKDNQLWPHNVKQIIIEEKSSKIDIKKLFLLLGKWQINIVWIESGPTLAGLLLKNKMVDELILYVAPKILGYKSRPLFFLDQSLLGISSNFIKLIFKKILKIGSDIRLILKPIYK